MGTLQVNGTISATGSIKVNNTNSSGGISMWEDGEGGTLTIASKNNTYIYHIDAYNDETIRIHTADKNPNGEAKFLVWNGKTGILSANGFNGNASTASKLATARTISLTGSVTGSGTFDGSGNLSIATTTNHTHSYLPLSGGTVTGTLTLSRTTDAAGTTDKKPALIVGGASTAQHLEFDGNEIMSKSNGTTPTTLHLNGDGGLVSIGSGGLNVNGGITSTGGVSATFYEHGVNTRSNATGITTNGWYDIATIDVSYSTQPSAVILFAGSDYYYTQSSSHLIAITSAHWRSTITKLSSLARPSGVTNNGVVGIGVTWNSETSYTISIKTSGNNTYFYSIATLYGNYVPTAINFKARSATPTYTLTL